MYHSDLTNAFNYCSYLRNLVPLFNVCVDQFVEKLRGVANGKTEVPMRTQFSAVTLHIIGKVCS